MIETGRAMKHTQPKKNEFYIGVAATKSNDLQNRKLFILKKTLFHNDVTMEIMQRGASAMKRTALISAAKCSILSQYDKFTALNKTN
jgi:hypothetical protein